MTKTIFRISVLLLVLAGIAGIAAAKPSLKCTPDGNFKVLMMSDLQDGAQMDLRTLALSEKLLQTEKPDLVILGGDCIAGYDDSVQTLESTKKAMDNVAQVFEKNHVPWAVVLGNHDTEHSDKFVFTRQDMIRAYMAYPSNINKPGPKDIHGAGNDCLTIKDSKGKKPVFNIWMLDSGTYAPEPVQQFAKKLSVGPNENPWREYEWIHTDQVWWYYKSSQQMEERYGAKIPGLMYFHMPIREFVDVVKNKLAVGDRYEGIGCSSINSGLMAAILERGDVKGIFCGHEHVNNFAGEWMGVMLGYDASNTYSKASYNLPDTDANSVRTRGARVFLISEKDPWKFKTWMRFSDGSQGPVLP